MMVGHFIMNKISCFSRFVLRVNVFLQQLGKCHLVLMAFDLISVMLHDAILLWAYGVNKTLAQGYRPNDGLKVTENIINMTFQGKFEQVAIDHRGDRKQSQRLYVVQNGTLVPIFKWDAVRQK